METRFTLLVGCRLPFQLAVLGGVGTTELAAAVSAARSVAQARWSGNRSTMPPTRAAEDPLAMACYAGTSVAELTRIQPAADVLRDLASRL